MKNGSVNGFDRLAPVYDALAGLIYGKSIVRAQTFFLNEIPPSAKVLILGGGTGKFLPELSRLKPDCEVWFVDSSIKMLERARQRNNHMKIHFIHGTMDTLPETGFDIIITNFFLDLFKDSSLERVIPSVVAISNPHFSWFVTDFVNRDRWWQSVLLKVMYLFFGWTCRIGATKLPDWNGGLTKSGLKEVGTHEFYHGFIKSSVFTFREY